MPCLTKYELHCSLRDTQALSDSLVAKMAAQFGEASHKIETVTSSPHLLIHRGGQTKIA